MLDLLVCVWKFADMLYLNFPLHSSIDFCVCCCTYSSLTISVIYLFYFSVPSHPSASCAESNLYFLSHVFPHNPFFLNSSILLHNLFSSQHSLRRPGSFPSHTYTKAFQYRRLYSRKIVKNGDCLPYKLFFLMFAMSIYMGMWCTVSSHTNLQ